ncbi:YveK family protein [Sediminibacillus massiliensis]|uniref:YveK family protein n=1 Tax=Sediminibacillus massiliensis TaxID=1926277 RepID=UPI0009884100|nr:Wzz/FepE/Etk N-terminal domain-containing protein [Sediminibacillus massiliensis]
MGILKQVRVQEENNAKEISLRDYFEVVKKRFWMIIVITILTTLAGYYYGAANNVSLYQSSTRMIVSTENENMNTLMVMITDPIIMEQVTSQLKLDTTPEWLARQIEVTRINDSEVVDISVTHMDPQTAADIANTTAGVFKSEIVNILKFEGVQLLSEAKVNPVPINGSQNNSLIVGFIFGIVAGIGLVFLLDSIDGTVNKEREVEEVLGVPVLGVISNMNKKKLSMKKQKAIKNEMEFRGESVDVK